VHIDELLADLARFERDMRAMGHAPEDDHVSPSERCWPPWLVLLHKFNNPNAFRVWWEEHGKSCPACTEATRKADSEMNEPTADDPEVSVLDLSVEISPFWSAILAYAAEAPPDLDPTGQELPYIQYHAVPSAVAQGGVATWLVSWDNRLLVLATGPQAALAELRDGGLWEDHNGAKIGALHPLSGLYADILAPGGKLEGRSVACFICDAAVAGLQRRVFTIPRLLAKGIRLVPPAQRPEGVPELIGHLVSHHRLDRFLGGMPTAITDPAVVLTVSAYLRLLHLKQMLTPRDYARLSELAWLPEDLRQAFRGRGRPADG